MFQKQQLQEMRPTAKELFSGRQCFAITMATVVFVALGVAKPIIVLYSTTGVCIILFALAVLFKTMATLCASQNPQDQNTTNIKEGELPRYTVLVPLYREARVLPQLVENLSNLDYPSTKLEVLLLLETDDEETIAAVGSLELPSYFQVVLVPLGVPRTKPRALNFGLRVASGDLLVVYDAEDNPEPDQLKKAAAILIGADDVACVQAKLAYVNANQNWLTRLAAISYGTYFGVTLKGLSQMGQIVPLGGTSNHFKIDILRKIGGWDSYNVTEDLDLGTMLMRAGWQVRILDSITWEETTASFRAVVRQQSRWQKGHLQTALVHLQNPLRLLRDLGPWKFVGFLALVPGAPITMAVLPFFWAQTVIWFVTKWSLIQALYPGLVFYLAVVCMVPGTLSLTYYMLIGCLETHQYSLVKWALLSPFYWVVVLSPSAWKGILQLLTNPHYWEKTEHVLVTVKKGDRKGGNNQNTDRSHPTFG